MITQIAGCAVSAAFLAGKLCTLAAGCATTGIGLIAAIGLAFGASILVGLCGVNVTLCLLAAGYFVSSWANTGSFSQAGFQAYTLGAWTFSTCLMVKPPIILFLVRSVHYERKK